AEHGPKFTDALFGTQSEIARSRSRRASPQTLQLPNRANLHRLDQAVHHLPWQASSQRDGRSRSRRISHPSRPGWEGIAIDSKSGTERFAFPLQGSAATGDRMA